MIAYVAAAIVTVHRMTPAVRCEAGHDVAIDETEVLLVREFDSLATESEDR